MPLLSGIELAIQMREHCPRLQGALVLRTSRHFPICWRMPVPQAIDFEVLSKPVHPGDLLKKIRTVIEVR
jgi:hypothetical protein